MQNCAFKKGLVFGILVLFIGISLIPITGSLTLKKQISATNQTINNQENNRGKTLYVGGSGPGNYSKIQDAIDFAKKGDTVFIYNDSSPYVENVYVEKTINLIGEDTNTTIIDAGGGSSETSWAIIVDNANNCVIRNLTFQNTTSIYGTNYAFFAKHSDKLNITNCRIRNSLHGMCLFYSRETFMRNNRFENNLANFGISGWQQWSDFINDIDTTNTVNGKPIYYLVSQEELQIDGIEVGYLGLVNCRGITVKNINVSGNLQNILLIYSKACLISNVTSYTSHYGQHAIQSGLGSQLITVKDCPSLGGVSLGGKYNTLKNCNLTYGVSLGSYNLVDSCNIDLTYKQIKSGVYGNIFLQGSSYNTISNCIIHNRTRGEPDGGMPAVACVLNFLPDTTACRGNKFINNTFKNCKWGGIWIVDNCMDNIVEGNRFINSSNDMNGAVVYITDSGGTKNNVIYNNSFFNNTRSAYADSNNYWNSSYPVGGNYWDDYSGIDIKKGEMQNIPGPDGLGDTPYDIPGDGNDKDLYPLMYPWNENSPSAYFTYKLDKFTIFLNASLSYDRDGIIISYDWDFGDGTTGKGVVINHTYSENTTYKITLTVTDDEGRQGQWSKWFRINNKAPVAPYDPDPINGSTNIDINADISWNCSDPDYDNLTYDVYFEADDPTPDILVSNNQSEDWYEPGTMAYDTHYYWQIVAWDEFGAMKSGPVWDFITGSDPNDPPYKPSNPNPEDGATDVDIEVVLSWTGGDPNENDTVVYDVFFEANDPTPDKRIADDISETTFNLGTLDYKTNYYWRIVAKDNHGASISGPIWHFTTVENYPPNEPSIEGPISGRPGTKYYYTFKAEEPNGQNVYYHVDWGDQTTSRFGPYGSGEEVTKSHIWVEEGTYTIKCRAKDPDGNQGPWGEHEVTISKSKVKTNHFFPRFLEWFPLLELLLNLI